MDDISRGLAKSSSVHSRGHRRVAGHRDPTVAREAAQAQRNRKAVIVTFGAGAAPPALDVRMPAAENPVCPDAPQHSPRTRSVCDRAWWRLGNA